MPVLFRLLSTWPLWLLHALGAVLGWVTFLASGVYRRRFLENARLAGFRFAQVCPAIAHAGRMAAESPRLWLGDTPACTARGTAHVEAAWALGKGIIFLTPHLGCFEITAQSIAQRWGARQGPITVLYRPARQPWLATLMETARNRPGMLAVPTTLSGVRQMIKALRKGEAVGLLPDQVPPDGLGQWAPFFGRPAYTMTLAARLAAQTGATVLLVHAVRLPWGRGYEVCFEPLPEALSQDLDQAVVQINQAMEHVIRQCPEQYLWGYARYKQPRREASAEATGGAA